MDERRPDTESDGSSDEESLPKASNETTEPDVPPPISDALSHVMERVLSRARRGVRRAIGAGRERLERRQAERDLEHFWMRLGKTAYRLVEAGELEHPALTKAMERIDILEQRIAEEERRAAASREEQRQSDLAGPEEGH